jgi:hypothetical protein
MAQVIEPQSDWLGIRRAANCIRERHRPAGPKLPVSSALMSFIVSVSALFTDTCAQRRYRSIKAFHPLAGAAFRFCQLILQMRGSLVSGPARNPIASLKTVTPAANQYNINARMLSIFIEFVKCNLVS